LRFTKNPEILRKLFSILRFERKFSKFSCYGIRKICHFTALVHSYKIFVNLLFRWVNLHHDACLLSHDRRKQDKMKINPQSPIGIYFSSCLPRHELCKRYYLDPGEHKIRFRLIKSKKNILSAQKVHSGQIPSLVKIAGILALSRPLGVKIPLIPSINPINIFYTHIIYP